MKKISIKANNENCPDYDKEKSEIYINYLHMNNLYGGAMSQYLPYGGFKWVKTTNETVNRILNKKDNSLHGCFLKVDLEYPENLLEENSDYPMAPEKIIIKEEWLSPYCLEIQKEHDFKKGGINKLVPHLMPKYNYAVHYRNLRHYSSQGLILKSTQNIRI